MDQLVVATSNREKYREFQRLLSGLEVSLKSLADFPNVPLVEETENSLAANARLKASSYARSLGEWVLSDDTGLEVQALGGQPGVCSARYAGPQATMAENRKLLLEQLKRFPDEQRHAKFVCCLALSNPSGVVVLESCGECRGCILCEPTGTGGFGYDALFQVEGHSRTLAEFSAEETERHGHRGKAVRRLLEQWNGTFPQSIP